MDGWMDGKSMHAWVHACMHGCMDACMHACMLTIGLCRAEQTFHVIKIYFNVPLTVPERL